MAETSTKPYLIRAIYEWCNDNGFTPYLAVAVDERTQVPREYVKGGEIVLNVSPMATNRLSLGNELIAFQARFGGVARELSIPVENVSAIYARENGHGMAFDVPKALAVTDTPADPAPHGLPSLPRPVSLAPAVAPVLDAGAPPGPVADPDVPSGPAPVDGPPDRSPPDGGGPRGRPHLTRVK
ncbi:MAG: ClpXP protease specificity-enhancing factor [Burkholderiaceae bacterium]|jgi:stringent starvation protein B